MSSGGNEDIGTILELLGGKDEATVAVPLIDHFPDHWCTGVDLGVAQHTVQEAVAWVKENPECAGFSFSCQGTIPDEHTVCSMHFKANPASPGDQLPLVSKAGCHSFIKREDSKERESRRNMSDSLLKMQVSILMDCEVWSD
jgi:hypothetical protein